MADTDILLKIGFDVKDAEKTAVDLQREVQGIFKSHNGQQSSALTGAEIQMKKLLGEADKLKSSLGELKGNQAELFSYNKDMEKLKAIENEMRSIEQKEQELKNSTKVSLFGKALSVKEFEEAGKKLSDEIEASQNRLQSIQKEISDRRVDMLQSRELGDFRQAKYQEERIKLLQTDLVKASEDYDKLNSKAIAFNDALDKQAHIMNSATVEFKGQQKTYQQLQEILMPLRKTHTELAGKLTSQIEANPNLGEEGYQKALQEEISKTEIKLDSVNDKVKQQIIRYDELEKKGVKAHKNIENATKKVGAATDKVRQSTKKTSSEMSKGFENAFKKIKKFGLKFALILVGVRSLRALIMKVRSAILDGFKNLQESGVGTLKEKMNDLTNAATTMKNSIAAAFEPLVTAAIPRIQQLVEWLTVAIDKLGQFIAAMRGQTKYIKAIKQVGDASKKANKELSKLDNLNVLNSDKSGGAAGMFEEVDIPDEMISRVEELKQHIQAIKDALDKYIFNPIKSFLAWILRPITDNLDKIKLAFANLHDRLSYWLDRIKLRVQHTFGVLEEVYAQYIKPSLDKIIGKVSEFFGILLDFWNEHQDDFQWIEEQFDAIWWESIQPIIDSAIELFGALFALIVDFVTGGDLENFRTSLNGLWDFLFPRFQQILTAIRLIAKLLSEKAVESMKKMKEVADLIRQILEKTGSRWNTFKIVVTAVFQAIRDAINEALDSLMKFTEIVDSLTGSNLTTLLNALAGVNSQSSSNTAGKSKRVRGAASGAVIPPTVSEHFIKVGDNHQETEIVSPLSTMQEAMINALQAVGIGGSAQEIVINMDGREILRALVKQNNEYKKTHGGISAMA